MNSFPPLDSVFAFPAAHTRTHGPRYTQPASYKPWLRDEFAFRCVYCLWRELWAKDGDAVFSIEHVIPRVTAPERICDYDNLVYACTACNSAKRDELLLDPCAEGFAVHLHVREDGMVEGLTSVGQRVIAILKLNRTRFTEFRRRLFETLRRIQQAQPDASMHHLRDWLGYPDDLPDLAILQPPLGNARPAGVAQSHLERRKRSELPVFY